jgi:hypothetical protein
MTRSMIAALPRFTEPEIAAALRSVEEKFPDDIEHVRYTVGEDWSGDPAIFTRVLLKDKPELMRRPRSREEIRGGAFFAMTSGIRLEVRSAFDEFHLLVYVSFRWASGQREMNDAGWD